jgi:integrase/recombinase XerC
LNGRRIKKSLKTRNWQRAQQLVQEMEAAGHEPNRVTIKAACDSFIRDAETRELKPATIVKYKLLFTRFHDWATSEGLQYLNQVDLEALRRFRGTWAYKNFALRNQTERLRALFRYAHDSGWIPANIAKNLKAPATHVPETIPFTEEEVTKILAACDKYTPAYNAVRLRALVLLLLHSGLRIGDAVTLKRSAIVGDSLTLSTQKTGTPVSLPLPPVALTALAAIPYTSEYYFTTGQALPKAVVGNYQNYLRKLFKLAGVVGAYPHKFRHTLAARLLSKRVPTENVSKILAHSSPRVTILHYSAWIKERQDLLDSDVRRTWEVPAENEAPKSVPVDNRRKSQKENTLNSQ